MDRTQLLLTLSIALFALGLVGVMLRRNALVMLMCMELMLNAVILALVTFSHLSGSLAGNCQHTGRLILCSERSAVRCKTQRQQSGATGVFKYRCLPEIGVGFSDMIDNKGKFRTQNAGNTAV